MAQKGGFKTYLGRKGDKSCRWSRREELKRREGKEGPRAVGRKVVLLTQMERP